jgi:membrane protein DedA with SNARE-associated domain
MMVWCAGAILAGDLLPFVLGRVFGPRLLRLRWMRILVNKQRLAMFDRWFRRRGDAVILIARFLVGLRVVAFFTAGTMKMPWRRFLLLDGLGILLIVPLLTWLGYHSATFIDEMIANVRRVERGILWATLGGLVVVGIWAWAWRRRRRLQLQARLGETFVHPVHPPAETPADAPHDASHDGPADGAPAETPPEQQPSPPPRT